MDTINALKNGDETVKRVLKVSNHNVKFCAFGRAKINPKGTMNKKAKAKRI